MLECLQKKIGDLEVRTLEVIKFRKSIGNVFLSLIKIRNMLVIPQFIHISKHN
jgi:hypothetical protein